MAKKRRGVSARSKQPEETPPLYFTRAPAKIPRARVKSAGVPDVFVRPASEIPVVEVSLDRPVVDVLGRTEAEILNAIAYAQRVLSISEAYKVDSPSGIAALENKRAGIESDLFWLRVVRGEEIDPLSVQRLGDSAPFQTRQQLDQFHDKLARLAWWREQRERGTFTEQQTPRDTPAVHEDYWSQTQGRIVDDLE